MEDHGEAVAVSNLGTAQEIDGSVAEVADTHSAETAVSNVPAYKQTAYSNEACDDDDDDDGNNDAASVLEKDSPSLGGVANLATQPEIETSSAPNKYSDDTAVQAGVVSDEIEKNFDRNSDGSAEQELDEGKDSGVINDDASNNGTVIADAEETQEKLDDPVGGAQIITTKVSRQLHGQAAEGKKTVKMVNHNTRASNATGKEKQKPYNEKDVCFEMFTHPGTKDWLAAVDEVFWKGHGSDIPDTAYVGKLKLVLKKLQGRQFFVDEFSGLEKKWRKATRKDINAFTSERWDQNISKLEVRLKAMNVGSRVAVYWHLHGGGEFFKATVTRVKGNQFHLLYDDGDSEWVDLRSRHYRALPEEQSDQFTTTVPLSSIGRKADKDDSNHAPENGVLKTEMDVCFGKGTTNQEGTLAWRSAVRACAEEYGAINAAMTKTRYQSIMRELKNRRFLLRAADGGWRIATEEEVRDKTRQTYWYYQRNATTKQDQAGRRSRRSLAPTVSDQLTVQGSNQVNAGDQHEKFEGSLQEETAEASTIIPRETDVCFGATQHPGTLVWKRKITALVTKHHHTSKKMSREMQASILQELHGRRFLVRVGNSWRDATDTELWSKNYNCYYNCFRGLNSNNSKAEDETNVAGRKSLPSAQLELNGDVAETPRKRSRRKSAPAASRVAAMSKRAAPTSPKKGSKTRPAKRTKASASIEPNTNMNDLLNDMINECNQKVEAAKSTLDMDSLAEAMSAQQKKRVFEKLKEVPWSHDFKAEADDPEREVTKRFASNAVAKDMSKAEVYFVKFLNALADREEG